MRVIKVEVKNCRPKILDSSDRIVRNTQNFAELQVTFDDAWDGFEKYAMFSYGSEPYRVAVSDDGTCTVPNACLASAGPVVFAFYGLHDEQRITSTPAKFKVEMTFDLDSNPSAEAVKSIQAMLDDFMKQTFLTEEEAKSLRAIHPFSDLEEIGAVVTVIDYADPARDNLIIELPVQEIKSKLTPGMTYGGYFSSPELKSQGIRFHFIHAMGTKKFSYSAFAGTAEFAWRGIISFSVWMDANTGNIKFYISSFTGFRTEVYDADGNRLEDSCTYESLPSIGNVLTTDNNRMSRFTPTEEWHPTNKKYVDTVASGLQATIQELSDKAEEAMQIAAGAGEQATAVQTDFEAFREEVIGILSGKVA